MRRKRLKVRALAAAALVAWALLETVSARPAAASSQLVVRVVPRLQGVVLRLNGKVFLSDRTGVARLPNVPDGTAVLEVFPYERKGVRARFTRWKDDVFTARRAVKLPARTLEVGLETSVQLSQRLVDPEGREVPLERVTEVAFRGSHGGALEHDARKPFWLQSSRVLRRAAGLEASEIHWSVDRVLVDGQNVVTRGQQRFVPKPGQVLTTTLLLYTLTVTARDPLMRSPVGSHLILGFPDGRTDSVRLVDGSAVIHSLARGAYSLKVAGGGYSPTRPLVLTRNQEAEMIVLTISDAGIVGGALLLLSFGLLLIGRPGLRARSRSLLRIRRRSRLTATIAVLVLAGFVATPGTRAATAQTPAKVPRYAYYYIWFDEGSWTRAKSDLPLLGTYSSDDPEVMRTHMRWARRAGIDGFIVSWKSTEVLDRRLNQLARIAVEEGEFGLAIIYQGLDFERRPLPVARIAADLEGFAHRFEDAPVFVRRFLRPVVIWSGTWEYSPKDVEFVTSRVGNSLRILASERDVAGYERLAHLVNGNAYYWSSGDPVAMSGYRPKLVRMGAAVARRKGLWFAPAAPGFDARLLGGHRIIDRRDGETLRRAVDDALASSPSVLALISWNEFSENSHIEPSRKLGTSALESLGAPVGSISSPADSDEAAGRSRRPNLAPILALAALVIGAVVSVLRLRKKSASSG